MYHTLDLTNRRLVLGMNVSGVLLLFIFGWLFLGVAAVLAPQFFWLELQILARLITIPSFLVTIFGIIVLHELSHALFFWLFSREIPKIGFNLLYAYAAAPDWYFPRWQFILIALAPVLLLTLAGIVLMPWTNLVTTMRLELALTVNAAGAIGDDIVVVWALGQPANLLLRDTGSAVIAYKSGIQQSNNREG